MDRNEMNTLNRGQPIDASYQVSVHLAKRFQKRRVFKISQTRNKRRLWRPCSLTDRDEMNILYRGPSIDASYQVSANKLAIDLKIWKGRRFDNTHKSDSDLR